MMRLDTRIWSLRAVLLLTSAALACDRSEAPAAQASEAVPAMAQPAAAAAPPPSFSASQLDEILAPIALYPDTLLAQILAASTNAQEVLDGGNWLLQHQALKGDELDAAATEAGFGPSMIALVHFPTVVDMLCQELDWTTQLGEAFVADEKAVLASVQRLRAQALAAGNLASGPEQKVEKSEVEEEGGGSKQVITVQPAQPQLVYVPQYNPQQVYTTPAPAATSSDSGISTGEAVVGGLMAFGLGIMVANAFDDDDYCCSPHWGHGGVYYGGNRYSHNTFVYAPHYDVDFRPASGYRRPSNYPYAYNRATRGQGSKRNLNPNQSGYFKRFEGASNRSQARPATAATRPSSEAGARNLPQGEYAGARRDAAAARPSADSVRDRAGQQPQAAARRDAGAQARPTGSYAGSKASTHRDSNRAGTKPDFGRSREAAPSRAGSPSATPAMKQPAIEKPKAAPTPAARAPQQSGQRNTALAGNRGGVSDRAASSRGRASVASQQKQRAGGGGRRGR